MDREYRKLTIRDLDTIKKLCGGGVTSHSQLLKKFTVMFLDNELIPQQNEIEKDEQRANREAKKLNRIENCERRDCPAHIRSNVSE